MSDVKTTILSSLEFASLFDPYKVANSSPSDFHWMVFAVHWGMVHFPSPVELFHSDIKTKILNKIDEFITIMADGKRLVELKYQSFVGSAYTLKIMEIEKNEQVLVIVKRPCWKKCKTASLDVKKYVKNLLGNTPEEVYHAKEIEELGYFMMYDMARRAKMFYGLSSAEDTE